VRDWKLQLEGFKNNLNTVINPENAFLYGNENRDFNTQLASMKQWSIYIRISKHFSWGKQIPVGGTIAEYAAAKVPLVGTLQGVVMEESLAGPQPAANVTILLDGNRNAVTDSTGHYIFTNVPEGAHEVALDMEQLPTEYDPGTKNHDRVTVVPRGVPRADFTVDRLTSLSGTVIAPKDVALDNVIIRLAGTRLYTTPDSAGSFSFMNLHEGTYNVVLAENSLPDGYRLISPASVTAEPTGTKPVTSVQFEIATKPVEQKPVREMMQPSGGGPVHVKAPPLNDYDR
jgi:hypothetical protein